MEKKPKFALLGVAGYIAPRHLQAIRDVGGDLIAAVDPHDSVGVLDRFFPQAHFFKSFENFQQELEKSIRQGEALDYVSICSPNSFHEAHIRFALRNRAHAICEKPLALTLADLDEISHTEKEFDRRVYTILQLRIHPSLIQLRESLKDIPAHAPKKKIVLTYITPRGPWYHESWKGDEAISGGLITNIGVHFFDLLCWFFGKPTENQLHQKTPTWASGFLEFPQAEVQWFVSINKNHLQYTPSPEKGMYRSFTLESQEIEFSEGFADLHTQLYKSILDGRGFGIEESRTAIGVVEELRLKAPIGKKSTSHPFLGRNL